MATFTSALPASLLQRAFESKGEFAWSRSDAIRVIETLDRKSLPVIGVDIWIPSSKGPVIPAPFVYDWDVGRARVDPGMARTALDFVRMFRWDPADYAFHSQVPFFNLVVVDD